MVPGYVVGKHFTKYVDEVKSLRKEGKIDEAEALLLRLVNATEAESAVQKRGVAPWYYEQLAIIYRKQKEYVKEVDILQRFSKQKHAPGVTPGILAQRLEKAKGLANKETNKPPE